MSKTQNRMKMNENGSLPDGWKHVKLADVVVRARQVNPARTPHSQFKYVDVSSISRENLRIESYEKHHAEDAPSRARKMIKTGDVTFATVRPNLRRIALVPSGLDGEICSTAFYVIRANPDLADGEYLYFAVSWDDFVNRVSGHQRGSSYPAVTGGGGPGCLAMSQ